MFGEPRGLELGEVVWELMKRLNLRARRCPKCDEQGRQVPEALDPVDLPQATPAQSLSGPPMLFSFGWLPGLACKVVGVRFGFRAGCVPRTKPFTSLGLSFFMCKVNMLHWVSQESAPMAPGTEEVLAT